MIRPARVAICDKCGAKEFAACISLWHLEEHLRNLKWELHKDGYKPMHPQASHYCAKCVIESMQSHDAALASRADKGGATCIEPNASASNFVKAVQDQFSPVVVKTIECLARELRKNIGVIDSPAMCVKCGFKIHAPTTGKVLSQCPECYSEMKTIPADV